MFDRKDFKKRAWAQAKGYWKLPLLITIGTLLVSLIFFAAFFFIVMMAPDAQIVSSGFGVSAKSNDPLTVLIGFIVLSIFMIFTSTILIAFYYFFVHFAKDNKGTTLTTFFEGFSLWHKGIRAILWEGLWISLWAMLFYIPGIVKAIAYSQMYFILADKPHVGVCKSMRISKEITRGYKGDIFFMCLSFLGWFFLAGIPYFTGLMFFISLYEANPALALTFLFGGLVIYIAIFVILMPYIATAFVYAYNYLLQTALDRKAITPQDIGEKNIETVSAQAQPKE